MATTHVPFAPSNSADHLSLVARQPQLLLAKHNGFTRVSSDEEGRGER